jgi:Domain of unknown function (DUF4277)
MRNVHIERLHHIGIIVSVTKDMGLIDMTNARLASDQQEVLTPGDAVADMVLYGFGFAHRRLSLNP